MMSDKMMSDGSDMPPVPDAEPAGSTDTVPLALLSMPDDTEKMQPPAVGDEVNYQVTGKVTAINGGNAVIERTTINGQPVDDNDGDTPPDDEAGLQAQAGAMDNKSYGAP